jgi:hypothetical protein
LLEAEDDAMAHREQHSNREAKKPKKEKPKTAAAAPTIKRRPSRSEEPDACQKH